jgi:hypothetical protein
MSKRQHVWLSIAIMVIGVVFLIWGGRIYNAFPGIKEAKHLTWLATKSAGIQYIIGAICLYGGYFYMSAKTK